MFVNIESLGWVRVAAWGQKNGVANRPAYSVKEKQTSLIDRIRYFFIIICTFPFLS